MSAGPLLALLVTLAMAGDAQAAVPPFRLPQPVVHTLPNGLTVAVFRDTRLPLAQVQLTVSAGSGTEGSFPAGIAYITSQLIGQSTSSRDATTLQEDLERAGGHMASRIGRDVGILSGTFLASQLPLALELVADAATHALITDSDFTRARRGVRLITAGPAGETRQPEDRLWSVSFGDSGYGHAPAGTVESLERMTVSDVHDFYTTHWGPAGAMLAIAGDVQPDSVMAVVTEVFGPWSARTTGVAAAASPAMASRSMSIVHRKDASQCEVWVGVPGPRAGDADEIPVALASQLAARSVARLAGVRAGQSALRSGGFVWLAATARVDSAAIVARRLEAAFTSLRAAAPATHDLEMLEQAIQASFPMRFESLDGLVDQWSAEAALGLGLDELVAFPGRVQAITPAQIAAAARKWFDPARVNFVVTGPAERLRGPLAAIAPIVRSESIDEPPTPALERMGRERLGLCLKAHGSLVALKKITTSVLEAAATMRIASRDAAATISQMRKEPDRMVYDLKSEDLGSRDVLAGNRAWSSPIDTLTRVLDADSSRVSALRQGFRSDVIHLLLDAADPRARVVSRGTVTVNGMNRERLEVWTAFGSHRILFLDPNTHLLAGLQLMDTNDRGGSATIRRWYHDYRAVDGIRLPFDEERWLGEQRMMRLKVTRYALNGGLADELFAHPEAPLPPASR